MEFDKIILPGVRGARGAHRRRATCASECIEGLKERYGDPLPDEVVERLDTSSSVINDKGYRGLLPDRRRLHAAGPRSNGIGVGPGRGVGRRLDHRVLARHHEPRPDRERAAVRALPQPRAHRDARYRHGLRRRAARRGHRLRPRQVRRGQGRADHHVRHDEGARGGARRRACARLSVRGARPDLQDDPRGARRHDRRVAQARTPSSRPTTRPTPTPSASSTPRARSRASCAARACTPPAS